MLTEPARREAQPSHGSACEKSPPSSDLPANSPSPAQGQGKQLLYNPHGLTPPLVGCLLLSCRTQEALRWLTQLLGTARAWGRLLSMKPGDHRHLFLELNVFSTDQSLASRYFYFYLFFFVPTRALQPPADERKLPKTSHRGEEIPRKPHEHPGDRTRSSPGPLSDRLCEQAKRAQGSTGLCRHGGSKMYPKA